MLVELSREEEQGVVVGEMGVWDGRPRAVQEDQEGWKDGHKQKISDNFFHGLQIHNVY